MKTIRFLTLIIFAIAAASTAWAEKLKVLLIDLKTNAGGDVLVACGQGGRSDSEEGIEEDGF